MGILSFLWHPAKRQTGVYKIVNQSTGWIYIGATQHPMVERWDKHRRDLNAQRHHNARLQSDWNRYGSQAFRFVAIEVVDREYVFEREREWQRIYYPKGKCYNPDPDRPLPSFKKMTSPEMRQSKLFFYRVLRGTVPRTKENIRTALEGMGVRQSEEAWEWLWEESGRQIEEVPSRCKDRYTATREEGKQMLKVLNMSVDNNLWAEAGKE